MLPGAARTAAAVKLNIGHWEWIRIFKFTPVVTTRPLPDPPLFEANIVVIQNGVVVMVVVYIMT